MKSLFRRLFRAAPARPRTRLERRIRPEVESLEDRRLMTITPHNGIVMPHVEVQALYYGSDWNTNSGLYNQTGYLEGFLGNVVNSSCMDMLGNAGYGVGRGSFNSGWITYTNPDKTQYLDDSTLRSSLVANINAGHLAAPDANRLYVIYVEP